MKEKGCSLTMLILVLMTMGHTSYGATEVTNGPKVNVLVSIMVLTVLLIIIFKMHLDIKKLKASHLGHKPY